jgi:hypothetical protein
MGHCAMALFIVFLFPSIFSKAIVLHLYSNMPVSAKGVGLANSEKNTYQKY